MKENIAIIGEENFIYVFRGLGIDVFAASDIKVAGDLLEKLVKEQYPIIYITESYAHGIMELIEKLNKISSSSIVIIPGVGENKKLGEQRLTGIIRKAIGSEVINNNNK